MVDGVAKLLATTMFRTSRWDEILLSVTKIPWDDVLESLYKLRILEFLHVSSCFFMFLHVSSCFLMFLDVS